MTADTKVAAQPTEETQPKQVFTYRAVRPLRVRSDHMRQPGELFPEGHLTRRIGSSVHIGRVREVWVGEDEFRTALDEYVSDEREREQILARAGLQPGVVLRGPNHTPGAAVPATMQLDPPKDKPADTRKGGPKRATPAPPAKKAVKATPPKKGTGKRVTPGQRRVSRAAEAHEDTNPAPADPEAPQETLIERTRATGKPNTPMRGLLDDIDGEDEDEA